MPYCKIYHQKNKEKIRARREANRIADPEKRKSQQRQWNFKYRLKKLGITDDWFNKTLEDQKGRCAICGCQFNEEKPYVDHCHKTGCARGILCLNCNTGLGHLEKWFENDFIIKATKYLKKREHSEAS